ncbi:hypothetical protein F5051DRAFT_447026 [Lentinula edodes]|nr:hypothetical protein F5051DRAFT_447026 [Lentinula edodes]
MASSSSQTRLSASTTLLPTSLMEAQVILAGLSFKSTLPLFFESAVFQRLQQGDYSPPMLDSQNSPDFDGSNIFPAFLYSRPLVPFCFPAGTSHLLSIASGLDLYCSAQMAVRTLQSGDDDSIETDPMELYHLFEEAAPYLDAPVSEHFPTIPMPFCLRFRKGSAMMRLVPSKELDVFASLRGKGSPGASKAVSPPKVSDVISPPPATKAQAADASSFFSPPRSTRSKGSDNELLSGFPSAGSASRASSSTKVSMGRKEPKSKTTVKVVKDSKASKPTPSAMGYKRVRLPPRSRKIAPTTAKGKSRQVVVSDDDSASNEVESEDEDEDEDEEEDAAPPPKRLKMTSSISASVPRRSAAVKPAPERSPNSTFQPVLLADAQGCLQLPEQSTGNFTPFPKFAHARNSAALSRENPLLAINPDFVELGSILETQNARFTMQDLMQVNRVIRDPSIPSQACVSALAQGDLEANSAPLPGYKCQACSSRSLKCLGSLDVELAMDMLNVLHKASTSSTHNLASSLRRAADLNDQLKQIGSLFDTTRELFLWSILDLQNAGEDPIVVLEALKAAEPNRRAINLNEWTLMAPLFHWPSPFNLSGLDFDNRTPGEWIELLRSIHSGESTVRVDDEGHLVESSPPLDSAAEVLEGLNEVKKGSADEGTSSQVGGSIPMELDLPAIESLAEPTLSPEKGAEPAQTL